ncbi:calmodulin-like protein containing EF hand domain [Diplonema papillatum]|nr:calmodulin-like protein containing EF hand domain [Diplonema papillatum]
MAFIVHVAADLFHQKENLKFEFPHRPSMPELSRVTESVYDVETRSWRPPDAPDFPFRVQQFQIHNVMGQWIELINQNQLTHGCQVFAFQPSTTLHRDVMGAIPPPKNTVTWMSSGLEPIERCCVPALTAFERKSWVNFKLVEMEGAITYWTLRNAMRLCQMELLMLPLGDSFTVTDVDKDGTLSPAEWDLFDVSNPGLVSALYFRWNDALRAHPSVVHALDAAIFVERNRIEEYVRLEKKEKKARQRKVTERLSKGKASYVTSHEVKERERYMVRIATEEEEKRTLKEMKRMEAFARAEARMRSDGVAAAAGALWPPFLGGEILDVSPSRMFAAPFDPVAVLQPPFFPAQVPPYISHPTSPRALHSPRSPTNRQQRRLPSPRSKFTNISSTANRLTPTALSAGKRGTSFAAPGTGPPGAIKYPLDRMTHHPPPQPEGSTRRIRETLAFLDSPKGNQVARVPDNNMHGPIVSPGDPLSFIPPPALHPALNATSPPLRQPFFS